MPFDLQTWKTETAKNLQSIGDWLKRRRDRDLPYVAYGALATMTLYPVVMAAVQNDQPFGVLFQAAGVAGTIGAGAISTKIGEWVNRADDLREADIEQWVDAEVAENADLRIALDAILHAVEAIPATEARLSDTDRAAFAALLAAELPELGSHIEYHARAGEKSQIIQGNNNVMTIVNHYHANGGKASPEKYQAAMVEYLKWLRDDKKEIVLPGIRQGEPIPLALDMVYVPLAAEAMLDPKKALQQQMRGKKEAAETKNILMSELLLQENHLAVIGGPGSGKTTVLQHIAWTLSMAILNDDPDFAKERLGLTGELPLPIFIPLSRFNDHRQKFANARDPNEARLSTFINFYLIQHESHLNLPPDFFATLLEQGSHVILLLDGLDEVPSEDDRILVSEAVYNLTKGREHTRFVVTSRTQAYHGDAILHGGFRTVRVLPLRPSDVKTLINHTHRSIFSGEGEQDERKTHTDQLMKQVEALEKKRLARLRLDDKDENRLITSPLMVRMLLIVYYNEKTLPDQRAELYRDVVNALLTANYHPDKTVVQNLKKMGGDFGTRLDVFQYLAYFMHARGKNAGREVDEETLKKSLKVYLVERHKKTEAEAVQYIKTFIAVNRTRGGLMEEVNGGQHRFVHLSFQEFLAARYLAEVERSCGGVTGIVTLIREKQYALDSWWREVLLLLVGYLTGQLSSMAIDLLGKLAELTPTPTFTAEAYARAEIAASAYLEWKPISTLGKELAQRLATLLETSDITDVPPKLRAQAGDVLARLDDPRVGVTVLPPRYGRKKIPQHVFCYIPEGEFWMGDGDARHLQKGLQTGYWLSKYPVTVGQWRAFVAGGHNPTDEDSLHAPNNRPVVNVTWYEAVAYCRWLTKAWRTANLLPKNWIVRLPSEAEWEKGARGGVEIPALAVEIVIGQASFLDEPTMKMIENPKLKRLYPWGNDIGTNWLNYNKTGIDTTSAVGAFPDGQSVYGCKDMSGNVWEWCSTKWEEKALQFKVKNEWEPGYLEEDAPRTLRGGAFDDYEDVVSCAYRDGNSADLRNWIDGFRVVLISL